jgi:hypothetical protein
MASFMTNEALVLEADDFRDPSHWYWRRKDAGGVALADHEVRLDAANLQYEAFVDLHELPDTRRLARGILIAANHSERL